MNITLEQEQEMLNALKKGFYLNQLPYQNETICKKAVEDYPFDIQFVKPEFLTEELKLIAVKEAGTSIKYIENPSEEIQLEAVKQDGFSIEFIEKPNIKIQLEAIKKSEFAIEFIKNPSIEIQLKAVKYDGRVIQYIKNPSIEVQLEALKEDCYAIKYIKNQTDELKKLVLEKDIDTFREFNSNYETNNLKVFSFRSINKDCRNILAELINDKWLFTIGCQNKITKETFIKRIYHKDGGLKENPYRKEYLTILEQF